MEGFVGIIPVIKSISFSVRGRMDIHFKDGRNLVVPLSRYPSIRKMSVADRKKYTIADGQVIIWQACDEVFHIQDFLGLPKDYCYKG